MAWIIQERAWAGQQLGTPPAGTWPPQPHTFKVGHVCQSWGLPPQHLDLGTTMNSRMAGPTQKTFVQHPVYKWSQRLWNIAMFLESILRLVLQGMGCVHGKGVCRVSMGSGSSIESEGWDTRPSDILQVNRDWTPHQLSFLYHSWVDFLTIDQDLERWQLAILGLPPNCQRKQRGSIYRSLDRKAEKD